MSNNLRGTVATLLSRAICSLPRHLRSGAAVLFVVVLVAKVPAESPLTKLRQETRERLREEAVAEGSAAKETAVHALCDLYVLLRSDQRYDTSEMMQGDAAKIRRRLLNVAHSRKSKLKREKVQRPNDLSANVELAIGSAVSEGSTIRQLLEPLKDGQAGGAMADTGWQLVELIQRVVAPDFWEPVGGPGAIRYFAIRRVLVVRATSDVHEQLKDLLTALR